MPVDYSTYHPDWRDKIRPDILRRDGYKCVTCGRRQREIGYWKSPGQWVPCDEFMVQWAKDHGFRVITVYLQIAHLDHDKTNNDYNNLATKCARCHARYDARQRSISRLGRKKNRRF